MALENRTWILVMVAAVSLAISGAFLYVVASKDRDVAGSPAPIAEGAAMARAPGPSPPGAKGVPTMEQAADRLAKRLEQQDGSADDWALLARSYVELRQYGQAVRAFERALQKTPNDPQLIRDAAAARQAAQAPSAAR